MVVTFPHYDSFMIYLRTIATSDYVYVYVKNGLRIEEINIMGWTTGRRITVKKICSK